jgi:hypothetical protein
MVRRVGIIFRAPSLDDQLVGAAAAETGEGCGSGESSIGWPSMSLKWSALKGLMAGASPQSPAAMSTLITAPARWATATGSRLSAASARPAARAAACE